MWYHDNLLLDGTRIVHNMIVIIVGVTVRVIDMRLTQAALNYGHLRKTFRDAYHAGNLEQRSRHIFMQGNALVWMVEPALQRR
jgi:hypothetical protein